MTRKEKKKKKEISVDPFFLNHEEPLLKDTTGLEKYTVSQISIKLGRHLSWFMAGIATLALFLSLYLIMDPGFWFQGLELLLTGFLGFLGALNVLAGLLLITKE